MYFALQILLNSMVSKDGKRSFFSSYLVINYFFHFLLIVCSNYNLFKFNFIYIIDCKINFDISLF